MTRPTRPTWLDSANRRVPAGYWRGYSDAVTDLRTQVERGLEHIQWNSICALEANVRPADRSPVQVASDTLTMLLDDCRRGDIEVLERCRLLVDVDPEAASECLQLLCWLFTDKTGDDVRALAQKKQENPTVAGSNS